MPTTSTPDKRTLPPIDYINNPFMIGVKGVNLLFLKAQGATILLVIISLLFDLPSFGKQSSTQQQPWGASLQAVLHALPFVALAALVGIVILLLLSTLLGGISSYAAVKAANDEESTLSEALRAVMSNFIDLLWIQFLVGLKVFTWTLLLVVPGIIMNVRYSFALMAYFDRKLKGNAALKASVALTRRSWTTTFASQILLTTITLQLVQLLTQIGPQALLYRQFRAVPNDQRPAPHWLSVTILTMVVITAVFGLATLVILLINKQGVAG